MATSETPALDGWRRDLAPWLAVLEDRLAVRMPALPTAADMEQLWITFETDTLADFEPATWTLIAEALELVDLLVRVDAEVGWRLLLSVVDQDKAFQINEAALLPRHTLLPRYKFAYMDSDEMRSNVRAVFRALRRLIGEGPENQAPSSPAFTSVRQRLLDAWAQQHDGRAFDRNVEGRIEIKPQWILSSNFQSAPVPFIVQHAFVLARSSRMLLPPERRIHYNETVDADIERASAEALENRRRRAMFCIVAFDFELVENPATNEVLWHLLHTTKEGLAITELVIDQVVMPQLHFSVAGTFFLDLLGVWRTSDIGLKRFEFSCGRFDLATVGAVCSALALSQTISEFALTRSNSGRDTVDETDTASSRPLSRSVWWPWLAYALFSSDATHRIESVVFDVYNLTMRDVEAMRAVLSHPNPLAYVCALDEPGPKSPVLSTAPCAAILRPQTRVATGHRVVIAHEENYVDRGTANITSNIPHHIVRDNADEEFLEIVFPGSGVGWIERAAVQEIEPCPRRDSTTVTKLELRGITEESRPAVLELIRLVGGSLESLALEADGEPMQDVFMENVCTLCPRLTSLRVQSDLQSLNWLAKDRDESTGCQLERVTLKSKVVEKHSLVTMARALGNANHHLSKSLRAFHYQDAFDSGLAGPDLKAFCDEWINTLRANWRLEQCEFLCQEDPDGVVSAFKERLRAHNGEPICAPQKIAFLSVVTDPRRLDLDAKRRKTAETTPARYRLPREAAHLILAMAYIPSQRICG